MHFLFASYRLNFICPGICWVLHHWHCYDILGLSFPRWNGVCKCPYVIFLGCILDTRVNIHCICSMIIAAFLYVLFTTGWPLPGSSSLPVTCFHSLFCVFWGRPAVYIHGSHFWRNHTWNQPPLVFDLIQRMHNISGSLLLFHSIWPFLLPSVMKVSWYCWTEKIQGLCCERYLHGCCMAGKWKFLQSSYRMHVISRNWSQVN